VVVGAGAVVVVIAVVMLALATPLPSSPPLRLRLRLRASLLLAVFTSVYCLLSGRQAVLIGPPPMGREVKGREGTLKTRRPWDPAVSRSDRARQLWERITAPAVSGKWISAKGECPGNGVMRSIWPCFGRFKSILKD